MFLILFFKFIKKNYFLNIVLTWKIMGDSKPSVIYIYIYIDKSSIKGIGPNPFVNITNG